LLLTTRAVTILIQDEDPEMLKPGCQIEVVWLGSNSYEHVCMDRNRHGKSCNLGYPASQKSLKFVEDWRKKIKNQQRCIFIVFPNKCILPP
jgi:hypothetical protein